MKTQSTHPERTSKPDRAARGRALIDDWQRSGLSRSAYARQRQVGAHLLSYWFKRLQEAETSPSLVAKPVTVTAPDFVQVSLPAPGPSTPATGSASSAVEILFPRGVAVRIRPGVDLDLLRSVITALVGSPC
jgi:transposase-like protein